MSNRDKTELKQCAIVLTHGCNLRCNFCFEKGAGYHANDQIEYEDLRHLIDFCGEAGVQYVFLTGGEPLTYPHLVDILRYTTENYPSIISTIATNGVLLDDMKFCRQLVDSGLRYIDVSMKGADTRSWERDTGYNGLARQLNAIQNLSLLPIEFTCSMVVTKNNVSAICDAVQIARDNGASQFSFTFFIDNTVSDIRDQAYLEMHNPFALIEAFISQADYLSAITDDWWVEYSFPMCMFTEEQLKFLEGRLAGPCHVHLGNAITVSTQMELLPCDMYMSTTLGMFGKEFSSYSELLDLKHSPDFQNVMKDLRKQPSPSCQPCQHLDRCYGGCPVLWNNYSYEALMDFKNNTLGIQ